MNKEEKIVQRVLRKIISEEWIAATFYEQMVLACKPEERDMIKKIFLDNSIEEKNDHYEKIIEFTVHNGFDAPCKISEYETYADEDVVKQFNEWSKGKDAGYYLEQAIESEQYAIRSYAEILADVNVPDVIKQLILEIYYDEIDHLGKLNTTLYAYKVSAQINF